MPSKAILRLLNGGAAKMRISYLTPVIFAVAVASALITTPTQADLGDQLFKLLADDGATDD